jgi:photosystem II stability/assembly factor-like uncharacterized protein
MRKLLFRLAFLLPIVLLWSSAALADQSADSIASPLADLSSLRWRALGPFRGGWSEMVVGIPDRPDTFLFGAAGGGVWRTDNAGRTWLPLFDHGTAAPVGAIAVAPSDPDTIYIGTGQPEPRYDVAGGDGVFRSRDGGRTWKAIGLGDTRHIGRIWVDPADRDVVLVAAVGHFFGSNRERGVFRSADGGETWSHVLAINADTGAVDLVADPSDPQVIFAATWQARQFPWQSYFMPVGGPGSGVHRSHDGGRTWERLPGTGLPSGSLGRISLAAARTPSGLRLYATAASSRKVGGIYRSDDAGASWKQTNDTASLATYYSSRIIVAPDDPDVVFVVGRSLRRCRDAGKTCEFVKGAPGGDDFHQVWINPLHPDHIAAASDQGTTISVDGGRTWSSWYNQPTGQFYHLAADDHFPYTIYSGQQDSGTVAIASRSDFGAIGPGNWHPVGGDERDFVIPDPGDPTIVYSSGLGGRVTRYDARTGQFANVTPFPVPNYGKRQTSTEHHFAWVTPLAISRTRPRTIYLGGDRLFASTDEGRHWRVLGPDLTGKLDKATGCDADVALENARACGYGSIWSIALSTRHAAEIWVATDSGLVQVSRDGGAHWDERTPAGLAPWSKIASIDLSERKDGVAYIAVDRQRLDDRRPILMRTRDFGRRWEEIGRDLPSVGFASVIRADPQIAGLLYAGTETGVYVSVDDGAHWAPLPGGLPTAWVRDLLVHGDDLIAATQGRGIWVLDGLASLRALASGAASGVRPWLAVPPSTVRVHFNNNHDTPYPPEEPAGENPPEGVVLDYFLPAPAASVEIEIRDAGGRLVRHLGSEPERKPVAERYFADDWIRPAHGLAREAGLHRTTWDLRLPQPTSISTEYSIAALPGRDTPINPQGPLALPGRYHVVLRVDGASFSHPLEIRQDPRALVALDDLRASLALSRSIAQALARAWQGRGEQLSVRGQLEDDLRKLEDRTDVAPLRQRVTQLLERLVKPRDASLEPLEEPSDAPGFESASKILAGIETDLESADRAPTEPQSRYAAQSIRTIDRAWSQWVQIRDRDLRAISATLVAAGLDQVRIPAPDQLPAVEPEGNDEIP